MRVGEGMGLVCRRNTTPNSTRRVHRITMMRAGRGTSREGVVLFRMVMLELGWEWALVGWERRGTAVKL